MGLELTMRVTDSYLQMKSKYFQRHNHKMSFWREYCDWMLTLPHFAEMIGVEQMAWIAKKVTYKGITFDSETECNFFKLLEVAKSEGRIKDFQHQMNSELQPAFTDSEGNKIKSIEHNPDFIIWFNNGEKVIVDTKGNGSTIEEVAKIKRKIFLYQNQDLKYWFIGTLPKYLGGGFVEVSSGKDFERKLKNRYYKINPEQKKKRGKKDVQWTKDNWDEHFEYEDVCGLFYRWSKTKKLKR